MSSKLQNSNRIGVRINEPVRNSANRNPALSKNQIEQANLVKKLPNDFPIAKWEQMNTRQQLHAMKYSGLNPQEQWTLLNATAPLSALNQHNQAQDEAATRAYVERSIAPLFAQIAQPTFAKAGIPSTKSSNSTPLQTTSQQRKLDMRQEEYETRFYEKAAARANSTSNSANPTKAPTTYKPIEDTQPKDTGKVGGKIKEWVDNLVSLFSGGVVGGTTPKKSTPKPVASTPKPTVDTSGPVEMSTEEPNLTPTPWLTPMPTSTPKPTPGQTKNQTLADAGVDFAVRVIDAPYSNTGRFGTEGYDCSGLVIAMCSDIKSKLPFGDGIRMSCHLGMSTDFRDNPQYGDVVYNYENGMAISELQAGDLVFYANPGNLKQDAHVAIATGEMMHDSKTEGYWPQVVEASGVAKKVTNEYPAYNVQKDGYYSRAHSTQVVTYVIRPNYAWEEQP